jgi:hypothetical protein
MPHTTNEHADLAAAVQEAEQVAKRQREDRAESQESVTEKEKKLRADLDDVLESLDKVAKKRS